MYQQHIWTKNKAVSWIGVLHLLESGKPCGHQTCILSLQWYNLNLTPGFAQSANFLRLLIKN